MRPRKQKRRPRLNRRNTKLLKKLDKRLRQMLSEKDRRQKRPRVNIR